MRRMVDIWIDAGVIGVIDAKRTPLFHEKRHGIDDITGVRSHHK